jgi:hypothetical protein
VLPYRRFAVTLTGASARLGADADRYSFTVVDFHHLLLAGFDRRTRIQDFCITSDGAGWEGTGNSWGLQAKKTPANMQTKNTIIETLFDDLFSGAILPHKYNTMR